MNKTEELRAEATETSNETLPAFRSAVGKARLVYENIEVNEEHQYALLSNGENYYSREEYTLIYTSSTDKKVHTKALDYEVVAFDEKKKEFESMGLKPGYLAVGVVNWKDKYYTVKRYLKGVIAHNGREVAAPEFKNILDIQGLLICVAEDIDRVKIIRYTGEVILELTGLIHLHLLNAWRPRINGREAVVIEYINAYSVDSAYCPQDISTIIYLIYEGEVYTLLKSEYIVKLSSVSPDKSCLTFKKDQDKWCMRQKEILKKMRKVKKISNEKAR